MTDHDALLRAICEHPDEDTPRLVFADWLDEHADAFPAPAAVRARAAFIRTDIAMSQRDEFDPARLRWERVEKPLREVEPWANETLPPPDARYIFHRAPLFRRGFAWGVTVEPQNRSLVPDPPADVFPLERVRYRYCGYYALPRLQAAPWRGRLSALEFERGLSFAIQPRRLFATTGLDRLERLAFLGDALTPGEARELVRWPHFARLTALTVARTAVGTALAEEVVRTGAAGRLRELHMVNSRIAPAALTALLDSPAATNLESLSAGGDRIGAPEKFRALSRAPGLPALRALDVSEDAPKEAGLEAFLASPLPAGLRSLNLSRCNLNSDRARMLAGGAFDNLRVLALAGNAIGNEGAAALARSRRFVGLSVLDLSYAQVGDEGILAILESPLADGLVLLDLTGSPASEETKEWLVGRMGDRVRV